MTAPPALYRGGTVQTMDPDRPIAEAIATHDGRIVAVGSEAECRLALGDADHVDSIVDVIDLAGQTLLPGFNDAHLHPMVMAFFEHHLDLGSHTSLATVLDGLADRCRAAPPGGWVMGLQVAEDMLDERRLPTRAELDAIGGARPVVVLRRDGHTALGNTAALRAAGIAEDATDPPGGGFDRDARGTLTGVCRETAAQQLLGAVPSPDLDELRTAARRSWARLGAAGITSVGMILQTDDEGPGGAAGALESVAMQIFLDELPQASHAILCGGDIEAILATRSTPLHDPPGGRTVAGMKLFLDGTLGARTACLHHPYGDDPSTSGYLTLSPEVVTARMEAAHLAGLQICVHAVGDGANHLALDLFRQLLERHPPAPGEDPCHRVEHASVLDAATIDAFAELGVVAVVQPLFIRSERTWLGARLGPDRTPATYPFATMTRAGVHMAGSSDAPIEEPDVLAGLRAATTRHGFEPAEAITIPQALALYTTGAARAQRREHEVGALRRGMRADLVVLSADPDAVAPERLDRLAVTRTVVAGRTIHAQPAQPA